MAEGTFKTLRELKALLDGCTDEELDSVVNYISYSDDLTDGECEFEVSEGGFQIIGPADNV
jgi:hypothetical protein